MNPLRYLALMAGAIVLWALPGAAHAQWQGDYAQGARFSCESNDGRYRECRVDTRQGVQLVRQTSRTQCVEGQSWGITRNGVWVDRGCRAEFVVGGAGYGNNGYGNGYGYGGNNSYYRNGAVLCESPRGRHNRCLIDTRYGVVIVRQLSDTRCREGHNWGAERGEVWVDHGCRAEFAPASGRYGNNGNGYGNSYGNRYPQNSYGYGQGGYGGGLNGQVFICSSNDGRRSYCRTNVYRGVELLRQTSRSACVRGQSWGFDRGGVWVSNGCRGEFRAW